MEKREGDVMEEKYKAVMEICERMVGVDGMMPERLVGR